MAKGKKVPSYITCECGSDRFRLDYDHTHWDSSLSCVDCGRHLPDHPEAPYKKLQDETVGVFLVKT
jgi:hypothetical protein